MKIEQFVIEGLGHQSYAILDTQSGEAAVVDPRRDIDVYVQAAQRAQARITHILDSSALCVLSLQPTFVEDDGGK